MILVTGATGNYGSKAIAYLLKKGVAATNIAALVRNEENYQALEEQGINIRVGDYADIDSMVKAFAGVDKLLLVSSNDRGAIENRTKHHINAITAAKQANVKHIVYTSFVRKNGYENSAIAGFQNSHVASEKFLKESGLNYTILQNGIYQEMILAFVGDKVAETGTILFPAQNGKASWVLREELAEVAVNVLTTQGHENRTYNLTNNTSVGFEKIATYISEALGKEVSYITPEVETFKTILEKAGVPEMYIGMFIMWGTALGEGMMDLEDNTLESLLGRKPASVNQFIAKIYG
ncbi:SDR family oxidoreductase [Pontibacter arcticus]|uniref:SDR family NAD(P)-dependent oxidoreductase n=1 Tax=Pontibacter arcticus TaxID=2080288 RepID=A0A364RFF8_9BACT|nr:SDR family oxidoreductase [Pontibacter arcticus]RAU83088.1 SDR family NAD(P)-dependent oxidoreductase [Pontibacter arcticus]